MRKYSLMHHNHVIVFIQQRIITAIIYIFRIYIVVREAGLPPKSPPDVGNIFPMLNA